MNTGYTQKTEDAKREKRMTNKHKNEEIFGATSFESTKTVSMVTLVKNEIIRMNFLKPVVDIKPNLTVHKSNNCIENPCKFQRNEINNVDLIVKKYKQF